MSTKPITVMVVDDEPLAQQRLVNLLTDIGGYEVVAQASNGEEALVFYESLQPEVILMDIRMPVMDGLQAAQRIKQQGHFAKVIFTTAYDDHALSAFEANAVDYVLKPIEKTRLSEALQKAQRLQSAGQTEEVDSVIFSQSHGNIERIPLDDVVYFLAEHKYITVRHLNGEAIIEDSLKSLEQNHGHFLRIHRNALVNPQFLMALEKDALGPQRVRFRGIEETLEVSRRHISNVRKYLKNM